MRCRILAARKKSSVRLAAGEILSQGELAERLQGQYAGMRHTYVMTYVRCGLILIPSHMECVFVQLLSCRNLLGCAEGCCWMQR